MKCAYRECHETLDPPQVYVIGLGHICFKCWDRDCDIK